MTRLTPKRVSAIGERPSKSEVNCCFAANAFDGTRKRFVISGNQLPPDANSPWMQIELMKKEFIRRISIWDASCSCFCSRTCALFITVGNISCHTPDAPCSKSLRTEMFSDIEGNQICGKAATNQVWSLLECRKKEVIYPIGQFITIHRYSKHEKKDLGITEIEIYGQGKKEFREN